MRKLRRRLVIVLFAVSGACGGDGEPFDAGRVVDRDHKRAHVIPAGKAMVPVRAKWFLRVEDCDPEPCRRGWVRVDQSTYDAHPVGSWWARA